MSATGNYSWAGDSDGPFFFDVPQNETACNVAPDSDISGIGVVLGFVIGALITTIASILAAFLDGMLRNEHRILPHWLTMRLPEPATPSRRRKWQLWRDVLEKLILGFADQQLVTGFTLLIAGYVKLYQANEGGYCYQNAHFYMVIYLACLSSGTHLACILTLRKYLKEHHATGFLRVVFIILFALFLTSAVVQVIVYPTAYWSRTTIDWSEAADIVVSILICLAIIYIYWITIMQSIAPEGTKTRAKVVYILCYPFRIFNRRNTKSQKVFDTDSLERMSNSKTKAILQKTGHFLAFSNGGIVFLVQIICSMVSLAFVLTQKFMKAPRHLNEDLGIDHGSLNVVEENEFGFGQIVALVLLTLPFLSALELYLEGRERLNLRDQCIGEQSW